MYYSEISETLHLAYFPIFVLLIILLSNSTLLKVFKASVWRFSFLGAPQDQLKNLHEKQCMLNLASLYPKFIRINVEISLSLFSLCFRSTLLSSSVQCRRSNQEAHALKPRDCVNVTQSFRCESAHNHLIVGTKKTVFITPRNTIPFLLSVEKNRSTLTLHGQLWCAETKINKLC